MFLIPSMALLAAAAAPQNVREPVALAPLDSWGREMEIDSDGGLTAAIWERATNPRRIECAVSDGRGVDWSPSRVVIEDHPGGAGYLSRDSTSLAVSGGVIYVAYEGNDLQGGDWEVYVTHSADQGRSWSAPSLVPAESVNLSFIDPHSWKIVADGDRVYVAVALGGSGSDTLVLSSSEDRGMTWHSSLYVSSDANGNAVGAYDLTAQDGEVFVAWTGVEPSLADHSVMIRPSADGGRSWDTADPIEVDQNPLGTGWGDRRDDFVVQGGATGLVVGWLERGASSGTVPDLRIRYSPDGGRTWPQPESSMARRSSAVREFDLGFDGETIVAGFTEYPASSQYGLFWCARSTQFGAAWKFEEVAPADHQISRPQVMGEGDLWAIAVDDGSSAGTPESSYLIVSNDRGLSWGSRVGMPYRPGVEAIRDAVWAFDSVYANFMAVWGDRRGYQNVVPAAGGLRAQSIDALSPSFAAGAPIHFEASLFPESDAGADFVVFVSRRLENFHLPWGDGRNLGLGPNGYLPGQLAVLSGTLDADGFGATLPTTVPLTPGVTWYAAAMSYRVSATTGRIEPQTLTDTIAIKVQ